MNNDITLTYETGLIGSIIIYGDCFPHVDLIVNGDDFRNEICSEAYNAASRIYLSGGIIDPLTIVDEMIKAGTNENTVREWVRDMMVMTPTASNAELYAVGIRNASRLRKITNLLNESMMEYTDPDNLTDVVMEGLLTIERGEKKGRTKSFKESIERFKSWLLAKDDNRRLNTGYSRLDGILNGLHPGNLAILAARPSVGKSALGCELALRTAESGIVSVIFSCEMTDIEITQRFLANRTQVNLDEIISKKIMIDGQAGSKVVVGMRELISKQLHIYDDPDITVSDIRRMLQTIKNVGLVVIDYIQIMKPTEKSENRNIEISKITNSLKQMAKEFQVPIVALSQLNRTKDEYDEPVFNDLRDSGAIEQDADKVIFLWKLGAPEKGEVQKIGVKIAKNRMSKTGTVIMQFSGEQMRFSETYEEYVSKKRGRSRTFTQINDMDLPKGW